MLLLDILGQSILIIIFEMRVNNLNFQKLNSPVVSIFALNVLDQYRQIRSTVSMRTNNIIRNALHATG